jgi:hypothetical protein
VISTPDGGVAWWDELTSLMRSMLAVMQGCLVCKVAERRLDMMGLVKS